MRKLSRRLSYGVLAAGLAGGAALGLGEPVAPPLTPLPPKPVGNPFVNRRLIKPVEIELAAATEPAARQEPAVSLKWSGPASVKVRERGDYTLTVRNTSTQAVQKVTVQVRVPKDAAVGETTPAAKPTDSVLVWELGTLEPKAITPIRLAVTTAARGDLGCQAWVTFTGTAGMSVAVKEPKLAAQVIAPERVAFGDPIPVTYVVRNVGDCKVDDVAYTLTETGGPPMPAGALDIGKEFRTVAQTRAAAGGDHTFTLRTTGSDGTEANASAKVHVMVPKLDVSITGPAERVVGRKAAFVMTVKNSGELPLENVGVRCEIPAGLRPLGPDGMVNGKPEVAQVRPGVLQPGQEYAVPFEVLPAAPGPYRLTAVAFGSRDTKATAECRTLVDGIPAMRMEVVDLSDPVEKGGETTYEIKVTNTGSKADAGVALVCVLPNELRFVSATGPTPNTHLERVGIDFNGPVKGTQMTTTITFEPVADLAPKTEAVFRVKVKAVGTGDARFKATLSSTHLTTPVVKEESTRVYGE